MRYIIIKDDGNIEKTDIITEKDEMDCSCGFISIIDVVNEMEYMFEGSWFPINKR